MGPEEVLMELGLARNEVKVYMALLKTGECTVTEIVKKTRLYSANVYGALRSLQSKSMVSAIKHDRKSFYRAIDPNRLFDIIDGRRLDLEQVSPHLEKLYKSKKSEREVITLTGISGVRFHFNDILSVNKEVCTMGSSLQIFSVMQHRAVKLVNQLKKEGIKVNGIFVDKPEVRVQVKDMKNVLPNANVRFYDQKYFSPVAFTTYGDRLVQIIWEDEPLVIIIKDRCVAKAFRNYFDMLWKVSKD